MVKISLEV